MTNPEYTEIGQIEAGQYVGPSQQYIDLREKVIADAKVMDRVSPCQRGMAYCCTPDVSLSLQESQEIIGAVRDGKIPEGVVKRVAENLADQENDMCPFLGKTRSCMIYEYRPLECVSFGRGALIVDDDGGKEAREVLRGEREDGLKEPGVSPRLCDHCMRLRDPDTSYPVTLIVSSQASVGYLQLQPALASINDVARTIATGEPTPFYINDLPLPFKDKSLETVLEVDKDSTSN